MESELATANLSTDKREKLEEKLAKLKADLAQKEAEAEIEAINKVTKADEKAQKERQKNLKKWLQTASQAVGTIGNLVSSIYDGQIQKIEEEREANEEKYDEDIERIENLAESVPYLKRKQKHVNVQQRIRLKPRIKSWKGKSKRLRISKLFGTKGYK